MQKATENENIKIAKQLLLEKVDMDTIATNTGLLIQEIEALKELAVHKS